MNTKTILGLDIGANSVGWALIRWNQQINGEGEVVDMGVRIFPAGLDNLGQGEKEESLNKARRDSRLLRRQHERRSRRKRKLKNQLQRLGLLPEVLDVHFWDLDPYALRKKALEQPLAPHELGRVLYHLNQRRGFKSNRLSGDNDDSAVFKGSDNTDALPVNDYIQKLDIKIAATDAAELELNEAEKPLKYPSLGALLHADLQEGKPARRRYLLRSMLEQEFEQILQAQKQHHACLTEDAVKALQQTIFYQRPLKSQKNLKGKCTFEPKKPRCPASHPLAQRVVMLQQVNQLRMVHAERQLPGQDVLTAEERDILVDYLSQHSNLPLKDIPKKLGVDKSLHKSVRFNLEDRKSLNGCKTVAQISSVIGYKRWCALEPNQQESLWHILYSIPEPEVVQRLLTGDKFGFTAEEALALSKLKLVQGFGRLSYKALERLLPPLEEGYLYHEAAERAGYHHSVKEKKTILDKLPPLQNDLRNPVVRVALEQVRAVVNCVIDHYGKPDMIKVELARDLKKNAAERKRIQEQQAANYKLNNKARDFFASHPNLNIQNPKPKDLIRYRLWEECEHTCPFTGKAISAEELFGQGARFDIEHILPRSRTLDNGYMNLTLCERDENLNKGDQTPYEYYHTDRDRYEAILDRARKLPQGKFRRFMQQELDEGFLEQQLNDTKYASRLALDYLQHICPEVIPVKGGVTASLRRIWGLQDPTVLSNPFLDPLDISPEEVEKKGSAKPRLDHRHHAVDALAVACTTLGMLQRYSRSDQRNDKTAPPMQPWATLVLEAKMALQNLIVSHKVRRKISGPLHESTFYGQLHRSNRAPLTTDKGEPLFAKKVALKGLKKEQLSKVIDPVVRQALYDWFAQEEARAKEERRTNPKAKASDKLPPSVPHPVTGHPMRSVRYQYVGNNFIQPFGKDSTKAYNKWVQPGDIHHMVLYRKLDKKGKPVVDAEVVSRWEAFKRISANPKRPAFNSSKILSDDFLHVVIKNELFIVALTDEEERELASLKMLDLKNKKHYIKLFSKVYRVTITPQSKQISFRHHSIAKDNLVVINNKKTAKAQPGLITKMPNTLKAIKLEIDPAGFLTLADDRARYIPGRTPTPER